jgi:hypothetical protein
MLDMGCGTGLWCIEMADDFPESTVVGVDLSAIQPSWVPPNCKFYVDDIESEWAYPPAEHFDYIHGRALCGSIADWRKLFAQALSNLKPGGYLEMQEYMCQVHSDDGTLENAKYLADWVEEMDSASIRFGKRLKAARDLKGYMEEAGFVDVKEEIYRVSPDVVPSQSATDIPPAQVPIGPWAKGKKNKELGVFYRAQFLDAVEPFTLALYTRVLGYSPEEAQIVVARVKQDLRNRQHHLWAPFHYIWGRKPGGNS